MIDRVSEEARSYIMSSVKSKDTGPELTVRTLLHGLGYRYELHQRDLPGSPDIVFRRRKKAIFVHGCFWHGHACRSGRPPTSKTDYWLPKIARNRERDETNRIELKRLGWDVLTIWQCELKDLDTLRETLIRFLGPTRMS